jgi:PHS family inorganic phosphate transporter-like MFS transporter
LGQAVAGEAPAISIYGVLIMWRFIMGTGIGGDYPLSAIITSEFAARRIRGRMMAAVFSAQGWGNLTSAIVSVITVSAYKNEILSEPLTDLKGIDQCWRIIIGLGCVPAVVALYFRLTIPETPRYTMDIERNIKQASQDVDTFLTEGTFVEDPIHNVERAAVPKATWKDFRQHFSQWKNFKILFGTSWSWFALDIAFDGLGLNSATILSAIGFGTYSQGSSKQENMYQTLYNVSVGNIILAVGGLIPGYYFTMAFVDFWGRKPIQLMGFILLTIIFCCMGFGYYAMLATGPGEKAFVFLYCMANFFQNFGPNTTTFIIPGEVFPTRYRSTGHGISAASGKLGAIISQVGFARLINIGGKNAWLNHILELFAFCESLVRLFILGAANPWAQLCSRASSPLFFFLRPRVLLSKPSPTRTSPTSSATSAYPLSPTKLPISAPNIALGTSYKSIGRPRPVQSSTAPDVTISRRLLDPAEPMTSSVL